MKFGKRAITSSAGELPSGAPLGVPTPSSAPALSYAQVAGSSPRLLSSSATTSVVESSLYSSANSSATSLSSLHSASSLSSASSSSSSASSFSSLSPTASLFAPSSLSRPTTPPSSRKLDGNWRTNASPPPYLPGNIVVGGIYRILEQHRVHHSSIIHSNLAFNAGAFNHPFVVIAEQDGIATVLCLTSQEQTALKHPGQHVAIGGTYYNLPGVKLAKGAMEKQSFVKTSDAYQIECANLKPFHRRGGTVPQLDAGSIGFLMEMVTASGRMRLSDTDHHHFVNQYPQHLVGYGHPHHHSFVDQYPHQLVDYPYPPHHLGVTAGHWSNPVATY